ncbi:protein LKAAEAR1 [Dipodomys spectabilis]|uniref:protein LKAAEAR1 n=1 Tax=Dipodomys spectabilis TaxID=105255 RepID=UPI001C53ECBF|nr:protein LKAAEAR1 [Dipodomys spectabilis]
MEGSRVEGPPVDGSRVEGSCVEGSRVDWSRVDGSCVEGVPRGRRPAWTGPPWMGPAWRGRVEGPRGGAPWTGPAWTGPPWTASRVDGSPVDGSRVEGPRGGAAWRGTVDGSRVDGSPVDGVPPRSLQPPAKSSQPRAGPSRPRGPGLPEGARRAAAAREPPRPGWALAPEELSLLSPAQRRRHLLFADLLDDMGASASIFPRDSLDMPYPVPDPYTWMPAPQGPAQGPAQGRGRLLGVLRAAEARGRVRALRLRYTRMRAEEIALLVHRQDSARTAIRLELFLPPLLKPTRIPDPLNRQERRRVEAILEETLDDDLFLR